MEKLWKRKNRTNERTNKGKSGINETFDKTKSEQKHSIVQWCNKNYPDPSQKESRKKKYMRKKDSKKVRHRKRFGDTLFASFIHFDSSYSIKISKTYWKLYTLYYYYYYILWLFPSLSTFLLSFIRLYVHSLYIQFYRIRGSK